METNIQNSENGQSQSGNTPGTQPQKQTDNQTPTQSSKEQSTRTMFLEYDRWKAGQHSHSVINKGPGDKRGIVTARIHTGFEGNPKKALYTAKDTQGNVLFPPTQKLWEVKKNLRENATRLLEQAKQVKKTVLKETKAIGEKVLDEGKQFASQTTDIATNLASGKGRQQELKKIRQRKAQRNKDMELEP